MHCSTGAATAQQLLSCAVRSGCCVEGGRVLEGGGLLGSSQGLGGRRFTWWSRTWLYGRPDAEVNMPANFPAWSAGRRAAQARWCSLIGGRACRIAVALVSVGVVLSRWG